MQWDSLKFRVVCKIAQTANQARIAISPCYRANLLKPKPSKCLALLAALGAVCDVNVPLAASDGNLIWSAG